MTQSNPITLINRKTGDWWTDDRRNWCAYCGTALDTENKKKPAGHTRDHIIPKVHKGRHITIPACRACNNAKADSGLPEFLVSRHFLKAREKQAEHQWSLRDLWLAMALAAVEQARSASTAWPSSKNGKG